MKAQAHTRPRRHDGGVSNYGAFLQDVYDRLLAHFGHRHWWPGDSRMEICIGAVLTQNTAWKNVEKAIVNLKAARALDARAILALADAELGELIRPSGYYNLKTKRLKALMAYLDTRGGRYLRKMEALPTDVLREELLAVYGVGKETADCVLLYALDRPVFVIDAYTRRLGYRLGLTAETADYDSLQAFFTANLPQDVVLYNDYHAQIVALCANICKVKPNCDTCPLAERCARQGLGPVETKKKSRKKRQ